MKIKLSPTRTWLADTVAKRRSNLKILLLFITAFFIFSCGNPFLDEILNEGKGSSGKDIWLGYTSIEEAMAWLKTQPTGDNATYPITLPLNIFLGDMTAEEGSNWDLLLIALAETGKYVNLDLSECYMVSPYIFDPGENSEGKNLIVTIVYPKQAKTIIPWNSSGKKYTSITDAMAWLRDQSAGDGVANPVTLALNIQLGTMPGGELGALLSAIADTGKYVNLDLSACSMTSPYEFNPYFSSQIGQGQIVSLVLPNQAQTIPDPSGGYTTFDNFSNLSQVSGANVTTIGAGAFESSPITSVNFPAATYIGSDAFSYCTSLTSVSLPNATTIGDYTFVGCTSLTSVNLPKATDIGTYAFSTCTGLTSVSIPSVINLEEGVFWGCAALSSVILTKVTYIETYAFENTGPQSLIITMGHAAPTLGAGIFDSVSSNKPVTVKVPAGAVSNYPSSWEDGFRGMGWTSGVSGSGTINTNISLTLQPY